MFRRLPILLYSTYMAAQPKLSTKCMNINPISICNTSVACVGRGGPGRREGEVALRLRVRDCGGGGLASSAAGLVAAAAGAARAHGGRAGRGRRGERAQQPLLHRRRVLSLSR